MVGGVRGPCGPADREVVGGENSVRRFWFLLEVIDGITRRATMRDPIAKFLMRCIFLLLMVRLKAIDVVR